MKFDPGLWILKIAAKLGLLKKVMKPMSNMSTLSVEGMIRQTLKKFSDDEIDTSLEKVGEQHWTKEPFATMMTQLKDADVSIDKLIQLIKDEKFLRDHRREHHPNA